jgi:hypothetical protein
LPFWNHSHPGKTRLVLLMVACAFLLSLTSLVFKFFAIHDEFWTTMFWTLAGQAVFGFAILAIGGYRRQFVRLLRTNTGALISLNAVNELVNLGGSLGTRYAPWGNPRKRAEVVRPAMLPLL